MIDALFINPNSASAYQKLANIYSAIEPPTWCLLLAQSCLSKGYKVEILDADALRLNDDLAAKTAIEHNAKILCFVVYGQNPNSGTTSMIGAYSLAKKIKEIQPDQKICFVGSHASALPEEVISKSYIDFVLANEGVYGIQDLIKSNFKDLHNCSSLVYKDDEKNILYSKKINIVSQENLDRDLPGYNWELLPKNQKVLDKYRAHYWHSYFSEKDRTPFAAIYSSLGCQFGCNFCMINILNRNNFEKNFSAANYKGMRHWSPEFFLNEIDKLVNYGVKTIRLSDEMFFLNKKFYIPILEGIIKRGYNLNMWAYARVDTVREDQLELFKRAGINWLALGIEAGNTNIRTEIEKGKFKDINIRDIVKTIQKYDINVLGNYIFGFPGDSLDSMNDTLDLAMDLKTEHANFYACAALPGSPLYFSELKSNSDRRSLQEYSFLSYETKPLKTKYCSPEQVLKFRDDAWSKYFSNQDYLNMIENKFGLDNRKNIEEMSKIKLKRKILGD